jgi:hypothetical protein
MEKHIIGRGLLAGALAGLLAFVWAKIFLEPIIGRAVDFEEHRSAAHEAMEAGAGGHDHGGSVELFTRGVQSNIGMGFGVLAFAVAMAALLAVVFCVAYNRVNGLSVRALSALIAGAMLIALWVVPALKYPPNPPATSLEETITQRGLLYLLMVGLSALLMVAAVYLGNQLAPKLGVWNAALAAAAAYIVAVGVVMLVLPSIDETPSGFSADDLYAFRLYSLGTQVVIWATIGLVFGVLAARLLEGKRTEQERLTA